MSPSSSKIKGGGRAKQTPELEDAIVDYLRSRRQRKNPLLSCHQEEDLSKESFHDAEHNRRQFRNRLVKHHERNRLQRQFNKTVRKNEEGGGCDSQRNTNNPKSSSSKSVIPSSESTTKRKVRLDLVEAVYKADTSWKPGSIKKTAVFDAHLSIGEFLQQAQTKLKMAKKKRAIRCFCVKKKIEIPLTTNLEGLKDGTLVYLTSNRQDSEGDAKKESKKSKKEEEDNDDDQEEVGVIDELDDVKQVYASRALRWKQKVLAPPILFSDHLDNLPPLSPARQQLPAARLRSDILKAVDRSRVVLVSGATGSGKSTQVPQFLLEGMMAASQTEDTNIVVTQPRRVAAMALAERVAQERDSPPPGKQNSTVGYHVRLDRSTTDSTQITYCTVGILLRKLTAPSVENAPPLSDISHLVIDEVHERDLNTDFCLTVLRRVLVMNPNIKLILMSATNTPELFMNYFSSVKLGIEPVLVEIDGRTFPVKTVFLEEIENLLNGKLKQWSEDVPSQEKETSIMSPRATAAIDNSFIAKLVAYHVHDSSENGAVLVFLPGRGEIETLHRLLRRDAHLSTTCDFHALHSSVPKHAQRQAFELPPPGKTKIVLASNIAETSITISDVTVVIDTGRVKESRYNSSSRIKELVTVWTSRASATQRSGRAGRVQAGTCYRLYTQSFFEKRLLERTTPEILRTPLDELVLQACLLDEDRKDAAKRKQPQASPRKGTLPVEFLRQTPDPPPPESLTNACEHLVEIGALQLLSRDEDHFLVRLTQLGYHLSQLPMDVKIGKILIVGSILQCVGPSLTIAAVLSSSKPIFWQTKRDMQKSLIENGFGGATYEGGTVKGDTIASIAAYDAWSKAKNEYNFAKEYGLDNTVLQEIRGLRSQYHDCIADAGFIDDQTMVEPSKVVSARLVSCCLVAGLYPNIATLVRPTKGKLGFRGGRLLTKDGDSCTPSAQSFQVERLRNVSENGRDVYAVYHSKHRVIGAAKDVDSRVPRKQVFLSDVNFVSRFTLLLFGGDLTVQDNFILIDQWLKFKVGDRGKSSAVLFAELRREMDNILLRRLRGTSGLNGSSDSQLFKLISNILEEEEELWHW